MKKIKTKILFAIWTVGITVQMWAYRKLIRQAMAEAGVTFKDLIESLEHRPSSPGGWG